MLFDKVMDELEDHYKRSLLSVADGTFDEVYSQRFKRTNDKSVSASFTKNSGQSIIFLLNI